MNPHTTSRNGLSGTVHQHIAPLVSEIIEVFGLSDLSTLLRAVEQRQVSKDLNLAVLGRFKAGKSSFLNNLIGQPLLPVGVLPVTAVVTEISYGEDEGAELRLLDGTTRAMSIADTKDYVAESYNPQNAKKVASVHIFLPSLRRFHGLKFVDTPGLESIFVHNTEAALEWSPNVDLAIVAIGVDPPLTQQDVSLIERLYQYTPNISILLTKIDILSDSERTEVEAFVRNKLRARFGSSIRVFPYSIKPEFALLQKDFEQQSILQPLAFAQTQRQASLNRKIETLLRSAEGYLQLSLKAGEKTSAERSQLKEQVLGSPQLLADQKLQLQLLAKHTAANTRGLVGDYLQKHTRHQLEVSLSERLEVELPRWSGSFSTLLRSFEAWLRSELDRELRVISSVHHAAFCGPLQEVQRQCQQNLGNFRSQLAERVCELFGIILPTAETEIDVEVPRTPDISIGKIFDTSFEIISFLIPMWLVRPLLEERFRQRIEHEVFKNLSRLTTQWEERIHAAIFQTEKEAARRLDEIIATVGRLLLSEKQDAKASAGLYLNRVQEILRTIQ